MNALYFAEISSTQSLMREWFASGDEQYFEYNTIITDHQFTGVGRSGKLWEDAPKTSLLMTTSFQMPCDFLNAEDLPKVSFLAGLALTKLFPEGKLKWPNDLIIAGKKVGGTLCEFLGERDNSWHFSVGLGLNLSQTAEELPKNTDIQAGSLNLPFTMRDEYAEKYREALENVILQVTKYQKFNVRELKRLLDPEMLDLGDVVYEKPNLERITGKYAGLAPDLALNIAVSPGKTSAQKTTQPEYISLYSGTLISSSVL